MEGAALTPIPAVLWGWGGMEQRGILHQLPGWVGLSRRIREQIWMFGIQKSSGDPCVGPGAGCSSQQGGKAEIQPDPAGPEQDGLDEQQGWAVS